MKLFVRPSSACGGDRSQTTSGVGRTSTNKQSKSFYLIDSLGQKGSSPKLVCIDIQPYQTTQACERADILNIGGFSDFVFKVISAFLADNKQRFVTEVEAVEL